MVKGVLLVTIAGAFGGMILGAIINPSMGPNQATILHQESVQSIQERTEKPNQAQQLWIENNAKSMELFQMTGEVKSKTGETVWELTSGDQ